jgi:hypothetical protein
MISDDISAKFLLTLQQLARLHPPHHAQACQHGGRRRVVAVDGGRNVRVPQDTKWASDVARDGSAPSIVSAVLVFSTLPTDVLLQTERPSQAPPHVPATACPRCSHRDARSVVSPMPPSTPHSAALAPRSSVSTSNNLHSHSASFLKRRNCCALPCQPICHQLHHALGWLTNHRPAHLARLLAAFSWCSTSIAASSAWGKYRCTFDGSPVSRCWT